MFALGCALSFSQTFLLIFGLAFCEAKVTQSPLQRNNGCDETDRDHELFR
jgi:hypothetical protein